MDWMTGIHLSEFTQNNIDLENANKVGQALWDFYMFQMHVLRRVHADPHPGNFLVDKDTNLIAIDFGCIKEVPDDFYIPYFELAKPETLGNRELFLEKLQKKQQEKPKNNSKVQFDDSRNTTSLLNSSHHTSNLPHSANTTTKRNKPQNSNEMLAYLSNREYKPSDVDDFANFNSKQEYSTNDYKDKFNDFFPDSRKKDTKDTFFVKSK